METMSRSLFTTAVLLLGTVVCIGLACGAGNPAGGEALASPATHTDAGKIAGGTPIPVPVAPISLSDSDGQELTLEELSARTAIHGMLSLTEIELRFRNPKSRRMEGRFSCTLPAHAAIRRFAEEVNVTLPE